MNDELEERLVSRDRTVLSLTGEEQCYECGKTFPVNRLKLCPPLGYQYSIDIEKVPLCRRCAEEWWADDWHPLGAFIIKPAECTRGTKRQP